MQDDQLFVCDPLALQHMLVKDAQNFEQGLTQQEFVLNDVQRGIKPCSVNSQDHSADTRTRPPLLHWYVRARTNAIRVFLRRAHPHL